MAPLTPPEIEALLVALLAVNNRTLEQTWSLLPNLRAERLTEPEFVHAAHTEEVIRRLAAAGYDRGALTWLFAERVQSLMAAIGSGALDELAQLVARNDRAGVTALLRKVHGIGPRVADNAWILLKT